MFKFIRNKDKIPKKRTDSEVSTTTTDKLIEYQLNKLRHRKRKDTPSNFNGLPKIGVSEQPLCEPVAFDHEAPYFQECVSMNKNNTPTATETYPAPNPVGIAPSKK